MRPHYRIIVERLHGGLIPRSMVLVTRREPDCNCWKPVFEATSIMDGPAMRRARRFIAADADGFPKITVVRK